MIDSHVHLSGHETSRDVLTAMDEAGIETACLIGPFLDPVTWVPRGDDVLEWANTYLCDVAATAPDRLWALATVDPLDPQAPDHATRLADEPVVHGIKLIPHDWDPEMASGVYAACAAAGLPILFHAGVFISGRCSDRCRPARFEVVRDYPALTVVLAHLGWPWVDEAIAVALMDPLKGQRRQVLLDISPGTPEVYRAEALRKAFAVLGGESLLFGSDVFCPFDPGKVRDRVRRDRDDLAASGATARDLDAIFGGNASRVFGRRAEAESPS